MGLEAWITGPPHNQARTVERANRMLHSHSLPMGRTTCRRSFSFIWMQVSSSLKSSFLNEWEGIKWKSGKLRLDSCFLKMFFSIPRALVYLAVPQEGSGVHSGLIQPLQSWGDETSHSCSIILDSGIVSRIQNIGLELRYLFFFFWFMCLKSEVVSLPEWLGTLSVFWIPGTRTSSSHLAFQQRFCFWTVSLFWIRAFWVHPLQTFKRSSRWGDCHSQGKQLTPTTPAC